MLIYAFYNYTFNYNENLILRISPLLVIGLFEASYESSILFHWMQWPLNLISRPVDVCFALQCSSSFINWRSKTLRILITPWYALLQFLCVRFPFVITHWQTLTLEPPQLLSPFSGQRVFVQTLKDGLWGQRIKTPHPGCWHCPHTAPLFMTQLLSPPPRLLLLQLSPPLIRAQSQAPRSPGCPEDTRMYVFVAIGPIAQCQAPGLSLLLICLFPSSHRTCLQNASAKMKLSKLSRWQLQSLNHTHWVRDHTIPDSIHMKPSHRLGKAALASICPFLSVVPPFNSSARGAGGRHRLPHLTSPSSPCCIDRQ